jgi:hypothetical protein
MGHNIEQGTGGLTFVEIQRFCGICPKTFETDCRLKHRQSRRQGLETQAKAPMMLRAIRDMALSTSMHGVAVQPWSFFRKKYNANPALFLFILWIEGHLNIVFLVYL